jgi:1-acyl-sn-glycerol-3-phosphate acyltransferase
MPMKLMLKKLHARFYRYSVGFFIALFYPFLYFYSRKPERYATMNQLRRLCSFCSSSISGIFYTVEYEQPIDWSRTYVVCPNHTSSLDVTACNRALKNNFHYMGKDAFLKNWALAIFFKTMDIPVNRDSKMSSFRAFKKAAENLQEGRTLVIFPEGKIPDDYPPQLNEFKNGPFRLAIELGLPIIPITCMDNWKLIWDTGLETGGRPGIGHVYVHKPIETTSMTVEDADKLKDDVFSIIDQKFRSANKLNRGAAI